MGCEESFFTCVTQNIDNVVIIKIIAVDYIEEIILNYCSNCSDNFIKFCLLNRVSRRYCSIRYSLIRHRSYNAAIFGIDAAHQANRHF